MASYSEIPPLNTEISRHAQNFPDLVLTSDLENLPSNAHSRDYYVVLNTDFHRASRGIGVDRTNGQLRRNGRTDEQTDDSKNDALARGIKIRGRVRRSHFSMISNQKPSHYSRVSE